tara:strand:+ start:146 stop:385 length:240 start_codon:yes stop_codon:yes gene_type:complete
MDLKTELQKYTKFLKQEGYLDRSPKNIMNGYVGEYIITNKALTLTDVVKPFYCHSKEAGGLRCGTQCLGCDGMERDERQ